MADDKSHVNNIMDRLMDHVMVTDPVEDIKLRSRKFVQERDWEQFQSPKNLAMALIAEAAELVEHFQWLTQAQSQNLEAKKLSAVSHELADIFIYLVRLCDELNIDLVKAANEKLQINSKKYPLEKVKGKAIKHTEIE